MTPPALLAGLMACAAITIGTAAGWMIALPLARRVAATSWPAAARARVLAQLRTLPLALAAIMVGAQVSAFARFEESRPESAGPLLMTLALIGALLAIDALWRGASSWRQTLALMAEWRARATPLAIANWRQPAWVIRLGVPVVAVVGAFRPQLFVARQVLDECTAAEMAAIAAHEAAHIAARDNLIRWLYMLTPGARVVPGVAIALERLWQAASEEAADLEASRDRGGLELASALTKVAKLTLASPPPVVAASALIGVSSLDTRVRRILEHSHSSPATSRLPLFFALMLLATAGVTQLPSVSALVHELFELLVRSH